MKAAWLAFVPLVAGCDAGGGQETTDDASADGATSAEASFDAASVDGDATGPDASASSDAGVGEVGDDAGAAGDALSAECAEAGSPPSTLACTGLYSDFAHKQVASNAFAYTPATPLWSDGAQKQRWIELPPNSPIDVSNPSEWTFPIGTKFFKEFRINGKRVETRMFQKAADSFWVYATYAWNGDDSEATINYGGPVVVGDPDSGVTWNIPTNDDCNECHRGRLDRILGFEQVSLGLPAAQGLTLAQLVEQGLVTPTPASDSLGIGDNGSGLDALALGWIHINCGVTCHNSNPSSAAYGAGMHLRLDPTQLDGGPPDPATWDILKTTLNVACTSGSFIGQPRIQPGRSEASVLDQLISERGTVQMPPIASRVVDTVDVGVIDAWIRSMDGGVLLGLGPIDGGGHGMFDGGGPPMNGSDAGPPDSGGPGPGPMDATLDSPGWPVDAGGGDGGSMDATAGDDGP